MAKAVNKAKVRGKGLGVDGYNVLITVEGILTRKPIVRCDDGFLRDLRAIFGKYRRTAVTPRALNTILRAIAEAKPRVVTILFDKQVSRSGELAAIVRRKIRCLGLEGDARTVAGVDPKVRGYDVVASSDRAIIKRTRAVWDLPAEILKGRKVKIIDLTKFH
jgi:hypothetical protein